VVLHPVNANPMRSDATNAGLRVVTGLPRLSRGLRHVPSFPGWASRLDALRKRGIQFENWRFNKLNVCVTVFIAHGRLVCV
jgi:hypothetical protein